MSQSDNSVNTSIVVFEYENKKMAAQCNDIIETIFNAQIVPKLEEVINHKIPKEVAVDLDSIEIDIGTIKAHEFNHELAQRIKNAFETALEAKLSILQNSIIHNNLKAADTPFYYLEVALEFYMVNGYFPIWFDAKKSLNQLDENIFDTSNTIILSLIENYIDDKIALKRLSDFFAQHDDSIIKEIALLVNKENKEPIIKIRKKNNENSILPEGNLIITKYYEDIDKNREKVIKFYLLNGNLPEGFKELNLNDIKTVYNDLIAKKFPFLEDCFNDKHINPNLNFGRLQRLMDTKNLKTVRLYLHHYFEEVYEILEKSINELQIKLNLANYIKLDFKIFSSEVLLKSLAHLKGKKAPSTVINQIHLNIKEYLPKKITDSPEFLNILKSQGLLSEKHIGSSKHQNDKNLNDLLTLQEIEQDNDERILVEELNPTEDLSLNNKSSNELDLKNQIPFELSILKFYAEHSYMPWWSDEKSLNHVLKSLEIKSTYSKSLFEEIFMQTENMAPFLGKLAFVLPPELKRTLYEIIAPYQHLAAKWVDSVSKFNQNQTLNQEKEPTSSDTVLNLEEQDFKLLKRSIYFLKDKDVLNTKHFNDPFLKNQLKIYLNLAPYFYFQNITPQKWRQILYSFVLINSNGSQSNQNTNFHNSLFTFLRKENHNISWNAILMAVYEKTQTSPISNIRNFPQELFKLIKKPVNEKDLINGNKRDQSEPKFTNDSENEIKVSNAGLIIFWPFLTRLFEQLNLMENGLFISPSAQNRAIYLLQYLVNNNTKVPEFELVLNKILVGMPISEHLEPIDNLSLEEKNMITSLMNGLIQNWPKMQNSTSIGIQETFIQREGILSIDKEHYKLVITKNTVDILVASIPWNLSLIKLPWMQKPLYIEWI
ncbi:contractile injection system tape measure protein [Maribacter sp. IgM3_T14_3]|uniref:contractile injection system tape measure protein n=1 Tax=Maribacter sp. IgM3_T14_3 TaxID=3415140 RepID=UPI003C6F9387